MDSKVLKFSVVKSMFFQMCMVLGLNFFGEVKPVPPELDYNVDLEAWENLLHVLRDLSAGVYGPRQMIVVDDLAWSNTGIDITWGLLEPVEDDDDDEENDGEIAACA